MEVERAFLAHRTLRQLHSKHLALLAGCATLVRLDPGDRLFRPGEEASSLILVLSGTLALATPEGRAAGSLGPGEVHGTSWLRRGERWTTEARALEPSEVLRLDAACLRRKCAIHPELGFDLAARLLLAASDRLDQLRRA